MLRWSAAKGWGLNMLPRFVALDKRMQELFDELVFRHSHTFDPMLSQIDTYEIQEGESTVMKKGEQEWGDNIKENVAEYAIKAEDCETFGPDEFYAFAKDIGLQFLDAKKRAMFETIAAATEATGNVVDRKGKPLDHDTILEALELIEIDFDENGEPRMPSLVVPPNMAPRLEQLGREAESDPEIRRRHDEIIEKKREAFVAREAARKLVG